MKVLIAEDNPRLRIAGIRLVLALGVVLAALSLVPLDKAHAGLRAPGAVSPRAEARVEAPPAFKWRKVRGAVKYEFQLSADRRFSSRVLGRRNDSRFTANTYATADKALVNGTYYWRVRAINARDHAGRWSRARTFVMAWNTPPSLLGPIDGATVTWPAAPLVLNWTPVPGATKYSVTIATDPSMASPIIGTVRNPLTTSGTVLALPGALAEGVYYWGVTPLNAGGHKGRRSAVGRFNWDWPSATNVRWSDLQDDPRVFDPQFSWDPVPGAARYEVEINASPDFAAGSKVCCRDATIGTSLSPTRVLANNVYYWRVRAVDADGNAGQWNVGARIRKDFDPVGPGNPTTIPNLHLRTNELASAPVGATVQVPVVEWDPVPGASSYEVQVVPHEGPGCNWTAARLLSWRVLTAATAWTPLSPVWNGRTPSGISWPRAAKDSARLEDGARYCVRVAARSDRDATNGDVVSDWTQLGGADAIGFQYEAPDAPGPFGDPFITPASSYLGPRAEHGTFSRLPLFTWQPVAGASSYFVAVARDASFTEMVDLAITQVPAYAPRGGGLEATTYPDESSEATDTTVPATYYWAVFPAAGGSGDGVSSYYSQNNPQSFQKRSAPPTRVAPADGSDVSTQPTFRWTPTEGARQYRLQVAQDANFRELIDDIATASTAYTSSSTYPVDTALNWRVRATDEKGLGMAWSTTGIFRRRLPVPAPRPENPLEGGTIPLLTWTPVEGAVSYDVHVDQADGRGKDFTYRSTAFSPTVFYGNGVWRWSVRANFPALTGRPASSGYFGSLPFTRRVDAPSGARGRVERKAMLLRWNPVDGAEEYRVEISRSNSFQRKVELIETQTTSWAPLMLRPDYRKPGIFYWRVTSIDEGNNLGGWRQGTVALGKALQIKVSGQARAGARSSLDVTVVDHRNRKVRGAKVRISGLGAKDRARTDGRGRATLSFRAKQRGTITLIARKKGYARAEFSVQVR